MRITRVCYTNEKDEEKTSKRPRLIRCCSRTRRFGKIERRRNMNEVKENERIQNLKSNLIFIPFVSNTVLRSCGYGFLVSKIYFGTATYNHAKVSYTSTNTKTSKSIIHSFRIYVYIIAAQRNNIMQKLSPLVFYLTIFLSLTLSSRLLPLHIFSST